MNEDVLDRGLAGLVLVEVFLSFLRIDELDDIAFGS